MATADDTQKRLHHTSSMVGYLPAGGFSVPHEEPNETLEHIQRLEDELALKDEEIQVIPRRPHHRVDDKAANPAGQIRKGALSCTRFHYV